MIEYTKGILPEWCGNPIIEALPPLVDDAELINRLIQHQNCEAEERSTPSHIRRKYLSRINNFVQPTVDYVEIYRAIEDALYEGYSSKNPLSPTTQHYLHYEDHQIMDIFPMSGRFEPRGQAITITGPSGAGKTYLLDKILNLLPKRIIHEQYKGKKLFIDQIVWMKVSCPENLSVTGLIKSILEEFDEILGTEDAKKSLRSPDVIANARRSLVNKMKSNFLGLLVIDELQNIAINRGNAQKIFLQFLLMLIDVAGIPIVFCGNPEIINVFKSTLRNARRAESRGIFVVEALSSEEWDIFVEHLWKYQWTNPQTPMSGDVSKKLYELSAGLPDFACRIFREAQTLVIGSGDERISTAVLDEAFIKSCRISHELIAKRRSTSKNKEQSDGANSGNDWSEVAGTEAEFNNGIYEELESSKEDVKPKNTVIGDPNRIHHEEFKEAIQSLIENDYDISNIDLSLLNLADISNDPLSVYKEKGLFFKA